jgi:CheY-like chemotaxis protein
MMKNKPVILVVDDQFHNILLLERLLVRQGYEIIQAESGEEALKELSDNQVDLVLLDVQMPGMSGLEVLAKLRSDKKTQRIPVVMVTAHNEKEVRIKALESGCDDFISKPFDQYELLARVKSLLRIKFLNDEVDEARDFAESVINTVREPLISLDQDLRVVTANHSFYETFKVTPENTIGNFIYDLGNRQWDIPKLRILIEEILPHDTVINGYEVEHDFPNIGLKTILLNARQIFRENIGSQIILLAMEDITQRKQLEEAKQLLELQLQQSQKLGSLGVLSGGVAHDFNNILAIIIGYCSLVKMDYEIAEKHIPMIEKAAERAAELCRQMLAYAGKAPFSQTRVSVAALVDEMVNMLKSTIKQNVVITQDLSADIPIVMGDAGQLRQIIMNLIINGSEAIGEVQGEICVSLAKITVMAGQSDKDHLGKIIPAGGYLCLEVSDNGCGMDHKTMQRIFEPFYTTKFTGRGLGMSAVLGIITAHNGALQLSSQTGHGTTFKVFLPVQISDSSGEGSLQLVSPGSWQGSGTILLVEDEEQILLIAKTLLSDLGFTVIKASNGREALELYKQNKSDITLVVTDMGMPVMDGYALFHELKRLDPELPIIISSGFGDAGITLRIPRAEIAGIVNKPYSFEQLRNVLQSVVEGALHNKLEI